MYLYKLNTHKVVEDCPVVFPAFQYFPKMQQYCSFFFVHLHEKYRFNACKVIYYWYGMIITSSIAFNVLKVFFFKKLGVLEMKVFCPRFTLYKTAKILIRILLVCTMYSWIQPLWNVKYAAAGIIPLHTHTHTLDKKLSYGIVFYFLKPTWGWCWYSINRIKSNSRDGGYYF